MSEIDTIISEIQSQSNRANIDEPDFKSSFDKLFNDTENEVVDILNRYELINDNTYVSETISSTPSHTRKSNLESNLESISNASTKVSALTHENLMKKQKEEEEKMKRLHDMEQIESLNSSEKTRTPLIRSARSNRYARSISSVKSAKSVKSNTDYSSLNNYKNTLKRKVKTQRPLDLTGSPNEILRRIDDMVEVICGECDDDNRKEMSEKHRDAILIQVFLNTMNTNRKDIAKACKEKMSKSSQKKTPYIS